ncbi:MAG: DUF84 family protein [Clostridia bacterium]
MDTGNITIALGTKNKAKREAVLLATGQNPICLSVPSGVSDQPLTEAETTQGAIHRAKEALARTPEAQIGLGLEGGLTFDREFTQRWYLISVCAAWDGKNLFLGKGLQFPIPDKIGQRVYEQNIELSQVIDELSGTTGSNHEGGAYGLLTGGRITRSGVFCDAVIAALTPFFSKLYV